ncbi:hypothetical protein Acr_14g0009220 [Actinidia rufa]|uniref:Probable zinc-ribbon domain-containing protein n=1 Tax=Actinidia rufa TaxID=165716 RepID=A0A7J0FS84_9ERIC|nr:hypothetical protein Acr_14g0009220 [Actinidia rufa]
MERRPVNNFDQNSGKEAMNLRVDRSIVQEEVEYYGVEVSMNWERTEFGNSRVENEEREFESPIGDFSGSLQSRPIMNPDEGPSTNQRGSLHGYASQKRIHRDFAGSSGVENSEHDRAELIKKIDELKDLLSRNCGVREKPRVRVPVHRNTIPSPTPPSPPVCPSLYSVNEQPFARDEHFPEPLYFNHNHEPVPYDDSSGLDMGEFYPPPRNGRNEFVGSNLPPMHTRLPHRPPPRYLTNPYNHDQFHIPEHPLNSNRTTLPSYQHESFSHHPACSCLQCYNKNRQIPSKPNLAHPIVRHLESYNSSGTNHHLHSLTRRPQTRNPNGFDLETGDRAHGHLRREVVACGSERVCLPIAGGAPFLTCCSCFQLLRLPRKLVAMGKNQQKVQCGECSSIISIEFVEKGLVVSLATEHKKVSDEGDDVSADTSNENLRSSSHNCLNAAATNSCSDDDIKSGDMFQLTDTETSVLSIDQRLNVGESHERQEPLSSTSSFPENDQNPDSGIFQKEISKSSDLPPKEDLPLPFSDSLDCKDPVKASSANVVSRYGMGNKSKRDDQEKAVLERSALRENYVTDVSVATEMEVNSSEFQNSIVSQDSVEVSKVDDQTRISKESEYFYANLLKRTFGNFSRSSQKVEIGRPNVFVNGQPMSDLVVQKAEMIAGDIQPGNYWYDYQAGFWGVMGHPCLGIIPPFIEEFNYPMPENCAAGNTDVFVNGRELNKKDLDLLASRGLPTTKNKSYVVEISGRVSDECTGEKLNSLGKLAPTSLFLFVVFDLRSFHLIVY